LYHFVSKAALNADGVGPRIIDALMDDGLVQTHEDLFTLRPGDIEGLPGFKEKSAQNIVDALQAAKKVPLHRLLVGLSIDHVGEETARLIAEHFGSLDAIRKAGVSAIAEIYGVGEIVAASLAAWMRAEHNKVILDGILRHVEIINPDATAEKGPLEGMTFVFTGTLPTLSRDEAKNLARQAGASVAESVSSKTSYVVLGENAGSKARKAEQLGVKTISEEEFKHMLG
jgi:DNA ligase (NAD+)